jgi:protoporphyrinogen oxidase
VGDRVAPCDLIRSLKNIILAQDDLAWGPNQVFYFPAKGGTGALWQSIAADLPAKHFSYGQTVKNIDAINQVVLLKSGQIIGYDHLITTIPLTTLLSKTRFPAKKISWLQPNIIAKTKRSLFASSVHVVGIGLTGQPPAELKTKCWLYYPEAGLAFSE